MSVQAICLKYGTLYGPEYVNRLYAALRRNTRAEPRLFCMTEDRTGLRPEVEILPLPDEPFHERMFAAMARARRQGRLRKVSIFNPALIPDLAGPLLFFDLDVVITGPVDDLYTYAPGKVCMRREWGAVPGQLGHGSVTRFDPRLHGYLYEDMARDPDACIALGGGMEQNYTSLNAARHGDFEPFPDEWIVSFKYDCRPPRPLNLILPPRLPAGARVVCFHGRPKMSEAVAGYRADPFHSTRRADWLTRAWSDE